MRVGKKSWEEFVNVWYNAMKKATVPACQDWENKNMVNAIYSRSTIQVVNRVT